jgi:hypothetical protein
MTTAPNAIPVIGYTVAEGNPAEGFAMYGFFQTADEAANAAELDRSTGPDYWILPIYASQA